MASKRIHSIALVVAGVHLLGVLLTAWCVSASTEGQAPLVWVYWMMLDLPWSLLLVQLIGSNFIVIHGIVGTMWWYFLAILVARLALLVKAKVR